jgi:hypothetical protein
MKTFAQNLKAAFPEEEFPAELHARVMRIAKARKLKTLLFGVFGVSVVCTIASALMIATALLASDTISMIGTLISESDISWSFVSDAMSTLAEFIPPWETAVMLTAAAMAAVSAWMLFRSGFAQSQKEFLKTHFSV